MSETDIVIVDRVLPRLKSVAPCDKHTIDVAWSAGDRCNTRSLVDLSPLIYEMRAYAPLRDDRDLFETIHLVRHGSAVAWGANDEIDMAATSVERLAAQTMTPQDFKAFLERHKFTFDRAAAELGLSRRLVAYYASERTVPRTVALACNYIDLMQ